MAVGVAGEAVAGQVDRNHPDSQIAQIARYDGNVEGDRSATRVGDGAVVSTGTQDPALRSRADGVAVRVVDPRLPFDATTGVYLGDSDLVSAQAYRPVGAGLNDEGVDTALGDVRGVVHAPEQIHGVPVVRRGDERRRSVRGRGRHEAVTAATPGDQHQCDQRDSTASDLRLHVRTIPLLQIGGKGTLHAIAPFEQLVILAQISVNVKALTIKKATAIGGSGRTSLYSSCGGGGVKT